MTNLSSHKPSYVSEFSNFWGIDVGGANLKMCTPSGRCAVKAFPMWIDFNHLGPSVAGLIADLGNASLGDAWNDHSMLAVTMTGELADCFETRRTGVKTLLEQLEKVIPRKQLVVYSVDGRWMSLEQAVAFPWSVAASNWHALASWCLSLRQIDPVRFYAIIDIGSTTVDIIPTKNGKILTRARTDRQRMELGQLVYTGMERTPIHAIVRSLRVQGGRCPVMAERFATIADANVVLECVAEEPDNCDTADGRPMTRRFALARLARMVGEDAETLSESETVQLARQICSVQARQVHRALLKNLPLDFRHHGSENAQPVAVLVCGHGNPLIDRLRQIEGMTNVRFEFLDELLGASAARCAPALAVSQLCSVQFFPGWTPDQGTSTEDPFVNEVNLAPLDTD